MTPTQEQLLKAGEHEQLQSLTHDAPQQRMVRDAQYARSRQAQPVFDKMLAGLEYDQPKDEDTLTSELIGEMTNARVGALNDNKGNLARAAIRGGRTSDLGGLLREANKLEGSSTADIPLKARAQARQIAAAGGASKNSKYLPALSQLQSILNGVGAGALRFSNAPSTMGADQDQMVSAIMAALQSGGSAVGNAFGQLGNAMDFSGLANSLANIKLGGSFGGGLTDRSGSATQSNIDNIGAAMARGGRAGRYQTNDPFAGASLYDPNDYGSPF